MMLRLLAILVCCLPGAAEAHGVAPGLSGFQAGAFGLVGDPLAVLGWLVLAVLAGMNLGRERFWPAECFAGGLAAGLLLEQAGWRGPPGIVADILPVAVIGALVAFGVRLPGWSVLQLAGTVGLLRGWHDGGGGLAVAAGLVMTGYVAMTCVVAVTALFLRDAAPWRFIAVRAAGSWMTAIALMVGGLALRG